MLEWSKEFLLFFSMKKIKSWRGIVKQRNKRILALRKKGLGYAEIGRKMGMSRQLIRYICAPVDKFHIRGIDKDFVI